MKSLVLGLFAIAAVAHAQSIAPTCTPGFSNFHGYGVFNRRAQPFLATVKQTNEQQLPNGNAIRGIAVEYLARDAQGRIMSTQPAGCAQTVGGDLHASYFVNVNDNEAKIALNWGVGDDFAKTVNMTHMDGPPVPVEPHRTPEEIERQKARAAQNAARRAEFKTEDLGTKTIAGVEAHGVRTTRNIPAGEEGNVEPLTIIDESWKADEIGIVVMAMTDDPRRGKSTYEVTELNLSIPDPVLFTPPADYKVVEHLADGSIVTVQK